MSELSLLDDSARRCLDALVDTLIPPDDWPGGVDGGAVDYLIGQFSRDLRELLPVYRQALALLDAESMAHHSSSFADLSPEKRTDLLRALERGESTQAWPFSTVWFVSTAASHAAEGFYGDPGNGGNRGGVSWKMIGFEVRG